MKTLTDKYFHREKNIEVLYCKRKLKDRKNKVYLKKDDNHLRAKEKSALRKLENTLNELAYTKKNVFHHVNDRKTAFIVLPEK